jgi:hypothetical protein
MATQARVIDFDSPEKETVGKILDLRSYYPDSAPSTACLVPRNVIIDPKQKIHIKDEHDQSRIEFINQYLEYISKALESPEIIYSVLDYKPHLNRYAQLFAIEVPGTRKFMTVVVALAKESEEEAAEHHIITIINAGYGYFFKRQGAGFGELKGKWLRVK